MKDQKGSPLGRILVRHRVLAEHTLYFFLDLQKAYSINHRNKKIGELLIDHRVATEPQIRAALSVQSGINEESITAALDRFEDTISVFLRTQVAQLSSRAQ